MQLIHGDCLEKMKDVPDKSIDMILCDLPYGTTACKWDTVIPFEPLWKQYKRVIKDRGAIVLFGSEPFTSALVSSNYTMFKYEWIWDKKKPSGFQLVKS
jgi:site-specific DNA-methyltransferase (adenine-specific)